ncbi:MAG: Tim44 domain-containing protein [Methylocella sp.]
MSVSLSPPRLAAMRAFSGEVRAPSNTYIGQPEAAAPSARRESTGSGRLQKRARPNSRRLVLFDLSQALHRSGAVKTSLFQFLDDATGVNIRVSATPMPRNNTPQPGPATPRSLARNVLCTFRGCLPYSWGGPEWVRLTLGSEAMAFRHKPLILILATTLVLGFAGDSFARAGGGFSFGSRGARTFSAPSATPLAPRAAPMERSMTSPNDGIFRRPTPNSGGFFSGGFGRGLLGGFIGAGLFGLLFGHGLFGGLGGGLSILGLLLQIGLLFLLFKFIMGFVRGRRPAFQGTAYDSNFGQGLGQTGPVASGFAGFGGGPAGPQRETKLEVGPADFGVFEQRLVAIQAAFGAEDFDRLRALATPEMASYFAEGLAGNANKGLVNRIADVKFLQGDLSEAWREQQGEYATVAMRFSLIDTMADRVSGKIVSGDPVAAQQATEVWTFARHVGGTADDWKLSAIQQA